MKQYFEKHIVSQAEIHAKSKYPEESCGFILEDRFEPIENIAADKIKNFRINENDYIKFNGQIKAIVHSHADYSHLSEQDMRSQIRSALPWGVILLNHGAVEHSVFWGDALPVQDLIGRPFIHGLYDCYALVRDYWRLKGYDVIDQPRENMWWNTSVTLLEDKCHESGFDPLEEAKMKIGDVVLMKVLSSSVNHSGIYIGDGLILHHLYNRLSRREPLNRWRKQVAGYLRYNKC